VQAGWSMTAASTRKTYSFSQIDGDKPHGTQYSRAVVFRHGSKLRSAYDNFTSDEVSTDHRILRGLTISSMMSGSVILTRIERGIPRCLLIKPSRSRVFIIWFTEGADTRKCR
jgi:hypothetical protein